MSRRMRQTERKKMRRADHTTTFRIPSSVSPKKPDVTSFLSKDSFKDMAARN
jgi:hypothetical protein